ncbi:MAG TPA: CPXCG motif-containing cysteine-rich protein [Gemmatimonadaceae bacterium]
MRRNDGNGDADHIRREELDEEFPLGDGTADLAALVECPYCGETIEMALDPGSGSEQDYVEDCEVCCQPWQVSVRYDSEGHAAVSVLPLTE